MKKFSKILSVALLVALVLSLGVANAFADENEPDPGLNQTANTSNPATSATINTTTTGHTYKLFQIFTGDPDTENENGLINLRYGQNSPKTVGAAVSQVDLEALTALVATANLKDPAAIAGLASFVTIADANAFATVTSDSAATVPTGYYLIKDLDNSLQGADDDAYTLYIMNVVQAGKTYTITPKSDIPHVDKKVKDINDSTDTAKSDWQDTADYDIGDSIDYQITGTLPSNFADYKTFKTYTFTDTLSAGLTAPEATGITVKVGETDVTNHFSIAITGGAKEQQTITISLKADEDLKTWTNPALSASSTFVVTYSAVLNDSAVIGKDGNPNEVNLKFSNNPNVGGDGDFGTTPPDTVIVFTFQLDVDKIDTDYNTLKGAGFVLLKKVAQLPANVTAGTYSDENLKTAAAGSYWAETKENTTTNWMVVKNWGVNAEGFNFECKGIDDGQYRIVETVVPTGYNKAADIDFTVTATHTNDNGTPADSLTELSVDNTVFKSTLDAGTLSFQKDANHKHDMSAVSGEVATAVVNNSGTVLPSTGGIGTTIFYVVGGVLVLAAIILLVTKKRMSD